MLNISKYHKAIVGGSAIATVTLLTGFGQSASAQSAGQPGDSSNATGGNVTTTTGGGPGIGPSTPATPFTAVQSGRAGVLNSNLTAASTTAGTTQAATAAASTTPPAETVQGAERISRVADAANCACPNSEPISAAPTGPSAELQAAQAAEAEAAAKLAAAKAEAREFIETVDKEKAAGGNTSIQIW